MDVCILINLMNSKINYMKISWVPKNYKCCI